MNLILASLLASLLAFIINRYLVKKLGNKAIVYLIPCLEEILKTGLFYVIGGNLVATHLIFGLIEAGFDYLTNYWAAFGALLSHFLFGYLTLIIWNATSRLKIAVLVVILIHISWNYLIGRIIS